MAPSLKTRFAPSPTGELHLGNVRTALFNWLLARHHGGTFLLRFEDTDLERSAVEFEPGMVQDLEWLGLGWHEGPGVGGEAAPYRQSERIELYNRHFAVLQEQGAVYPCFCSEQALKLARKAQLAAGQPPRYPGTCARLSAEEVRQKQAEGQAYTLRFRVPREGQVVFEDLVRGRQEFNCREIGDFIVRRSDGTPAFFFSNAVDDALMGVTHILRGEDHLTNTPRQLLLLKALALRTPEYGHTSMLVGADGGPLSKRHGSRSVGELRAAGFFPGAVVNYLARLGHHYQEEQWMEPDALAAAFSLDHLGRSPARFEQAQLRHWQKEAVTRASTEQLQQWLWGYAERVGEPLDRWLPPGAVATFVEAVRANMELPSDGLHWARQLFSDRDPRSDDAQAVIAEAGGAFFEAALARLETDAATFAQFARAVGQATGAKGRRLFMPLRAALTGETHGPELAQIWGLLEAESVRRRLESAARAES